jgi:bacterioferritin
MKVRERTAAVPEFAHIEPTHNKLLQRMARANIDQAAVADSGRGERATVLPFLNAALATKILCGLRYRRHHFMARGLAAKRIAEEFLVHSDEELAHADLLAERIVQLGGEPDFSPAALTRGGHVEYSPACSIVDMIKENLVAERVAIDSYRGLIESLGEDDPTTRRILEGILGVEEAHADELDELLQGAMRGK